MMGSMNDAKQRLRQQLRAARRALSASERAAAHRQMAAHLRCLVEQLPAGAVVALYVGMGDEADPRGLLALMPAIHVAWPRVIGAELELAVCDQVDLVPGFRGIPAPPRELPSIPMSQVRLIVVPALGYDRRGHRLGQGGGHYDRLLAKLRASPHPGLAVGLAYAQQVVPEVPCEPHDQAVDLVVTEAGLVHND